MRAKATHPRRLVLVGGGHAHVQVLKSLALRTLPGVQVTLISSEPMAPYSGMLPGHLAGWYRFDELHFELESLCAKASVRFIGSAAVSIDPTARRVILSSGESLEYDWCSVNVGIHPELPSGAEPGEKLVPLKPVSHLIARWNHFLDGLPPASRPIRVAVVGGGAAGVEVARILHLRLVERGLDPEIHLYQSGERLLPGHGARAGQYFEREFKRVGIRFHPSSPVSRATPDGTLHTENGGEERFDTIFLATGATPPMNFGANGLAVDAKGFLLVDRTLRSTSHPEVFGAGDCIHLAGAELPKAGVYAVREGRVLTANLRAVTEGGRLREYDPQEKVLALITSGDHRALASRGALVVEGRWVWKWKDRIDRSFMRRFSRY